MIADPQPQRLVSPVATPTPPEQAPTKPEPRKPAPMAVQPFDVSHGPISDNEGYVYYLLYGASGAGKTWLASSAELVPEMKRTIFLNIEAGVKSIVSSDTVRIKVNDFHTANRFYEWARRYCRARDNGDQDKVRELCELAGIPVDDYKTVIIDTLSELQALQVYQHLGINQDMAFDGDIPSIEWTEWNGLYEQFRLMLRKFRDLAMNVIIVIGEQEVDTTPPPVKGSKAPRVQGKILKRPELQGRRLPNEILKYFDLVGYLREAADDSGKTVRRLYIRKRDDTFNAKNRLKGDPPAYLDNPTMQDLYDLEVASQNAANTAAAPANAHRTSSSAPAGNTQAAGAGGGGVLRRPGGHNGNGQRRVVQRPSR